MRINVTSETTLSFDVEVDGDQKAEGILRMDGGSWYLDRNQGREFIGMGRISWVDALARALVRLSEIATEGGDSGASR